VRKPYQSLSLLGKELPTCLLLGMWRSLPPSVKRRAKTLVSQLEARWPGRARRLQAHQARFSRELRQILTQHETALDVIVFAPSARWRWPLFQRPHQLALAFARLGCLVFFCEPRYSAEYTAGFHPIAQRLYVASVSSEIFHVIESPVVFFLSYSTFNLDGLCRPRCVYDYIDELAVFPEDRQVLEQNHQRLLGTATLVIATAERLWRQVVALRPDVLLCPNGVDYSFIHRTIEATGQPPDDLAQVLRPAAPVIGYYGALAEWFDYELLRYAAAERSEYEFVLIGPDYDRSLTNSRIANVKNIHWLGVRPYPQLPQYLKYFDVAIIPFKLNEITHSTSPVKLFEYMAAGKPVVTTAMHESSRCAGVIVAKGPEDFVCQLDEALRRKADTEYLSLIDGLAQENTWDARGQQILEALSLSNRKARTQFQT
jgi:glycosyltransferase involved in cell wall biosynthesis